MEKSTSESSHSGESPQSQKIPPNSVPVQLEKLKPRQTTGLAYIDNTLSSISHSSSPQTLRECQLFAKS